MPGHPDKLDMLMLNMQASLLRIQPKLKPVIKHLKRKINKLNCLHIDSHRQRKSFQKTRRDQGKSSMTESFLVHYSYLQMFISLLTF